MEANSRRFGWFCVFLLSGITGPDASAGSQPRDSDVRVSSLRCEHKINPLGIDVLRPRLSWRLESSRENVQQTGYQIRVWEGESDQPIWDSGKVDSDHAILQSYGGPLLRSFGRYRWRVRTWDEQDMPTDWSAEAWWEMALLSAGDWQAQWIQAQTDSDPEQQASPLFRKSFQVNGVVRSARLYITALGLYEATLNGRRAGDQIFTPGWTSYGKRIQYQTYDVGPLILQGPNVMGAMLGDGWFRGFIGFQGQRNYYGDRRALLSMLRIEYEDGRVQTLGTDASWKTSTGAVLMSDIYMGETYDARLEKPGWDTVRFDDSGWAGALVFDHTVDTLMCPPGPPVRRIEEIRPVEILTTPAGDIVFDMGQNMVGFVRLQVTGAAGDTVKLQHSEVLDREGNFYTESLRSAKQLVSYTLKGGGEEVYEPHFSFQGFRYVKVEGLPGQPSIDQLTGIVVHSDMTRTGHFESSDARINQLQHNIVWGQKGNFLDVPTDCPQRDERLGWTGDAQVFVRTASFNMDVASFFTKWLGDLAADQMEDGRIPHVIPDVLGGAGSAGWADAGVIIPWSLYVRFGDKRLLERQYDSMKAWVDYMAAQAGEAELWTTGFHFGDWLSATYQDPSYPAAVTDKDFIASAFFAHSTDILARTASVLGRSSDAWNYQQLFNRIRQAMQREFLTPSGRLSPNSQTAYTLALRFNLLHVGQRANAAGRLVADILSKQNHLSTGFLGTPHLCHVLSQNGFPEVAYELLHQDTYPSWLYPVTQGATTIWERWDGIRQDGTFQDAGMNSFNHYAYGAIGEWLYGVVAGIQPEADSPGFKHFRLAPLPGGELTWVKAALESPYGRIESEWRIEGGRLFLRFIVPPNSSATLELPGVPDNEVSNVVNTFRKKPGTDPRNVRGGGIRHSGNTMEVEVNSGQYEIEYRFVTLE